MTAIVPRPPNTTVRARVARIVALAAVFAAALILAGWARGQGAAAGGEEPILVEAETTDYHYGPEGTVVEASGGVRASCGELSVSADYVRIDVDPGQLVAGGNVVARRGSSVTRCVLFSYNLKTKAGRVLEPDVAVPGVYARAAEMDVEADSLALIGAHVTGCDLRDPCYRVTARRLVIYPDKRVVVEWPVVWLEGVPVLVLPRLTIPVRGERVGWVEGEGYPVPRLAYNSDDGFVMGLSYLDRSRDRTDIRYEGAYATQRKGVQLEARADVRPGPGGAATLTAGYRSWDGLYFSGNWTGSASGSISVEADARYDPERAVWDELGDAGESGSPLGRGLEGGLAVRVDTGPALAEIGVRKDLDTYGPLYSAPAAEITTDPTRVPGTPITLSLSGGVGRFEEPARGTLAARAHAGVLIETLPVILAKGLSLDLACEAARAWYGTGEVLGSVTTTVGVSSELGAVEAFGRVVPQVGINLGYTRRTVSGATPFAFDATSPLDEASAGISVRADQSWTVGVAATYDLAGGAVKDLDLSFTNHHHCYEIRTTWQEMSKEFGLEVRFLR